MHTVHLKCLLKRNSLHILYIYAFSYTFNNFQIFIKYIIIILCAKEFTKYCQYKHIQMIIYFSNKYRRRVTQEN